MFPNRAGNPIGCHVRGPFFSLFYRKHGHGQCEDGTTPQTCERFLVSGFGTPNLHQVASLWLN
jgi:hypothetical protein